MANLTPSTAKAATSGDYLHFNTPDRAGAPQIPGQTGPFADFLLPGMGDARRFLGGIRNATGDVENQLGNYSVRGEMGGVDEAERRRHFGPITGNGVDGELEGWTQTLNLLAALHANTANEIATIKLPRFWLNQIKSGHFASNNGYESRITIWRGGLNHQVGMAQWRRIMPVPEANINNPSTFPGFSTIGGTEEVLTGTGYEAGWGSENINIDHLRNVPNAAAQVKRILDIGVDESIAMREAYNRETYIGMACLVHRAFVMSADCECVEDAPDRRVFIYDGHVACDAKKAKSKITEGTVGGVEIASGAYYAMVEDRTQFTNDKGLAAPLDANMRDVYGQYHADADAVRDPSTGMPMPFAIIDAGPMNTAKEIEPPNFDMLERLTEDLELRNPSAAVAHDGDAPVYALTIKYDDIDKLIRSTPIEWDAWRRAEPTALISHYGISKAKIYRRYAIVNDVTQMRFKILKYIPDYTESEAQKYGMVGYRPGDDTGLQRRAVYVALAVPRLVLSETRRGTNGRGVPVPNHEYADAPLAIANVFIRDTFENEVEGPAPSIGNGTDFGPLPMCNGSWGFINIPDKKTNPFRQNGNFYGMYRTHVKPTKNTQDATCFIYARDVRAFKAFTQAENKIINPSYTGEVRTAAVEKIDVRATGTTVAQVEAGQVVSMTLDTTNHLVLATGTKAELGKGSAKATVVVVDASRWPVVKVVPTAKIESAAWANYGVTAADGVVSIAGTGLSAK